VLSIEAVSALVAVIWGAVGLFWLLIVRWEDTHQTEARRREVERERSEEESVGTRVWHIAAMTITIGIPLVFVINGLFGGIGVLYSRDLSFFAGPDLVLQILGIALSVGTLAILIGVGRKLAVRVYRLAADERELMTTGLHRYVRHPFYLQFLLLPIGLFLLTLNYLALLVFISYNTLWGPRFITREALEEEADMRRRHGAAYDAYAARTGRFFPRLRRERRPYR
jgi:protein-S-isoprenylcysteine O-methyltransferase Ste14